MRHLYRDVLRGALLCIVILYLVAWLVTPAHAEMVTEIGGGIAFRQSLVLRPDCQQALIVQGRAGFEFDANGSQKTASCGGDNPIFVGWPIAWDFKNGNTRIGWFHFSHWFDGGELSHVTSRGDEHETSLNCLCVTHTFHWSKRK